MNRLKKAALLTSLTQKLRDHGSWCGETHLQKAVYFLEDLLGLPMGFDFIFYKHGPFSFDLRDELTSLRADELLKLEPQASPYGPRITSTEQSKRFKKLFSETLKRYEEHLEFVAEHFCDKGVTELEQLTTALYVTKRKKSVKTISDRFGEMVRLKPHISVETARIAIEGVDKIIKEAKKIDKIKQI
ncbi:MAG: hypothetical protein ACC651_14985 [Candidatus Scalindua sp.]